MAKNNTDHNYEILMDCSDVVKSGTLIGVAQDKAEEVYDFGDLFADVDTGAREYNITINFGQKECPKCEPERIIEYVIRDDNGCSNPPSEEDPDNPFADSEKKIEYVVREKTWGEFFEDNFWGIVITTGTVLLGAGLLYSYVQGLRKDVKFLGIMNHILKTQMEYHKGVAHGLAHEGEVLQREKTGLVDTINSLGEEISELTLRNKVTKELWREVREKLFDLRNPVTPVYDDYDFKDSDASLDELLQGLDLGDLPDSSTSLLSDEELAGLLS